MPLVPVSLDWVLGLILEPTGRSGLATLVVGAELGAERGAVDMDAMGIEFAIIL